jgi:hypothetical protein
MLANDRRGPRIIRLLGWLIALAGALAMLCGSAFAATTLQELQADVAACVIAPMARALEGAARRVRPGAPGQRVTSGASGAWPGVQAA